MYKRKHFLLVGYIRCLITPGIVICLLSGAIARVLSINSFGYPAIILILMSISLSAYLALSTYERNFRKHLIALRHLYREGANKELEDAIRKNCITDLAAIDEIKAQYAELIMKMMLRNYKIDQQERTIFQSALPLLGLADESLREDNPNGVWESIRKQTEEETGGKVSMAFKFMVDGSVSFEYIGEKHDIELYRPNYFGDDPSDV